MATRRMTDTPTRASFADCIMNCDGLTAIDIGVSIDMCAAVRSRVGDLLVPDRPITLAIGSERYTFNQNVPIVGAAVQTRTFSDADDKRARGRWVLLCEKLRATIFKMPAADADTKVYWTGS